jgi:hypothetical protein
MEYLRKRSAFCRGHALVGGDRTRGCRVWSSAKLLFRLGRISTRALVSVTLLLPVAGFVAAFILGLYCPGTSDLQAIVSFTSGTVHLSQESMSV